MPTVAEFFLFCFYALVGSFIVAVCIAVVAFTIIEVLKKWPR